MRRWLERLLVVTPTRKKRLLMIAGKPADHKPYYSQYLELMGEGLIGWTIGWAYLTEKGKEELDRMKKGR